MANYINKYLNQSAYDADSTKQYPNTSLVGNDVVYAMAAPVAFAGLTVVYDVIDASNEVTLFNGGGSSSSSGGESESESGGGGGALPTTMIVDGVSETPISTWRFASTGEHTVQYEFQDDVVPENFLNGVSYAYTVNIGTDIVAIASGAFNVNLDSATLENTTPPSIADVTSFGSGNISYPIFVPVDSVNTYKAATHWSRLSSRIYAVGTDLEHAENLND